VRGASQEELIRRIGAYVLLVGGGLVILAALPLWFWLGVLGAGGVAVGWYMLGK